MSAVSTRDLVVPGERLGVEEEAIPLQGVYVDEKGFLRALLVGLSVFDRYRKNISVKPVKNIDIVRQGAIVEARVEAVFEDIAFLRIYSVEGRRVDLTGVLHVSQATSEYTQSLYEVVKPGDYVRARILNNQLPYQLTIKEPGLGVVEAYCGICGGRLFKSDTRLVCKSCGNIESRKTSLNYLYVLR